MKVYCCSCGAADQADSQCALIYRGWSFVNPDDLDSAASCIECTLSKIPREILYHLLASTSEQQGSYIR